MANAKIPNTTDAKVPLDIGGYARIREATPSHPFTPDVVEWAEDMVKHYATGPITPMVALRVKAARQILAAVGRG